MGGTPTNEVCHLTQTTPSVYGLDIKSVVGLNSRIITTSFMQCFFLKLGHPTLWPLAEVAKVQHFLHICRSEHSLSWSVLVFIVPRCPVVSCCCSSFDKAAVLCSRGRDGTALTAPQRPANRTSSLQCFRANYSSPRSTRAACLFLPVSRV